MRIFTLEKIKVSSILDFTFYSICALFLALSLLVNGSRHQLVGNLLLILAGFVSWTAIEYLLHRFILHGLQPFKNWHSEHHKHPGDLLCLPTLLSAILVLMLFFLPVLLMFGMLPAYALTLGVLAGYLVYSVIHHAIHHWHIDSHWLIKRRRWHGLHHYVDETSHFGVTNAFWDYVFVKVFHI
jgi:cyclopropane-fatty-acyl-phospholipid synthase